MKTTVILRKAHFSLSILTVTLAVTLLITMVLGTKLMNQSLDGLFVISVQIIMGMMTIVLMMGLICYFRHKKVDFLEKWTLSLLGFGVVILAFLFVFELFLKP